MPVVDNALQHEVRALYADEHDWLRAWLRRKLGCAHHAADIAHDTFVRIIASRDALARIRQPRAFLVTTAKRLLVDEARRRAIEQAYLAELAQAAEQIGESPSPEDVLVAVQALQEICAALDGLATRARDAFLLHYLDDMPQAEVACRLGVSTRMVQKYLVQALLHCHLRTPA